MIAEQSLRRHRETSDDYDVVRQVIEYVTENWPRPPSLKRLRNASA